MTVHTKGAVEDLWQRMNEGQFNDRQSDVGGRILGIPRFSLAVGMLQKSCVMVMRVEKRSRSTPFELGQQSLRTSHQNYMSIKITSILSCTKWRNE